jgi:hypothetical protein
MSDQGTTTVNVGGMEVEGNSGASVEEITESLTRNDESGDEEKTEEQRKSEAAAELGRAGGKATSEQRAAEKGPVSEKSGQSSKPDEAEGEKKPSDEPKSDPDAAKPGEEAKEAAPDAPKDKPETEDEKAYREEGERRKRDARARVEEATRKEAEAKRERDAAQAEAARLRAELDARKGPEASKPEAKPADGAKPRPEDFENDPEGYLDARDKWNHDRWTREQHERDAAAELDRTLETHITKFRNVIAEAKLEITEDGVFAFKPEFMLPPGQAPTAENWIANELIFSPEHAPALVLHFQEHPDVLQRIAALSSPRAVSRALASLETRLEAAATGSSTSSAKPEEEVSKASPPIKPVSGAPYVSEEREPSTDMGFDKYHRLRQKQIRAGK